MNLPKQFLTDENRAKWQVSRAHGVFWAMGQFWLARGSPFNPKRHSPVLLLGRYAEPEPLPPTLDTVDDILFVCGLDLPEEERETSRIQAAILRATAREYFEA